MERQAIWQRYRLALALVPDEDVAGDLFMRARTEAELLSLANDWRLAQGLDPVEAPSFTPPLDVFQEEHALHLYRRGQFRRWAVKGLAWALPALLLVGLTWGWARWANQGPALAPAFQRSPVRVVSVGDGLRLSVYQVWAEPGEVTVWWDLSGPRATALPLTPALELPGLDGAIQPRETERTPVNARRMVARSTYAVHATTATMARLWYGGPEEPVEWVVEAPLEGSQENEWTVHPVPRMEVGPYPVSIREVTLSRTFTRVRYEAVAPPGGKPAVPIEIQVGRYRLKPLQVADKTPDANGGELLFEPVPAGATQLTIHFSSPGETVGPVVYQLPSGAVSPVTRLGDRVQALYRPEPNLTPRIGPGSLPYFTDQEGRRYEVLEIPPQGWNGVVQYSLVVLDPPPEAQFVSLTVPVAERSYPVEPLTIDLTRR